MKKMYLVPQVEGVELLAANCLLEVSVQNPDIVDGGEGYDDDFGE